MLWNFFDEIFCINLISRNDRLEKSKKRFNELNIPITYYRTIKDPVSSVKGCFESHLAIINYSFEKGYQNILIFEDDFFASPFFDIKLIQEAINFMERNTKWDIFYFGHQPNILWKTSEPICLNIMKTHSTLNHSYAISRRFMKKMYKQKYDGIAIDKIFLENNNSYALYPMPFYQDDSGSDIENSKPIRFMRFHEIYAYYINYSLVELLILLVIILFSIFMFIFIIYR